MMRYTIKCSYDFLNKISNYNISNIHIDKDVVTFESNNKNYDDIELIEVVDNYKYNIKKNGLLWFIFIFGMVIFCAFFIIMSKTITEIRFLREEMYSKSVYESVEKYLDRYLCFAFLEKDIIEINKELRSEYFDYEWINIKKEGTVLYIDVIKNENVIIDNQRDIKGSLYSKYDTYIEGYYTERGSCELRLNRSVKKGDLLISGYIKHYDGRMELVGAKGYVIGTIIENEVINVDKINESIERSGNKEEKKIYVFNNKSLNNPLSSYENYEIEYKNIINIFNLFYIRKVTYYELITKTESVSKEEAESIALKNIEKEFNENKKYGFEEIIDKKIISVFENEYDYEICVAVKKKVDITELIEEK